MNLEKIILLDADYSARMQIASRPGLLRSVSAFFAHSGDSWFWAVALIVVWWFGNPYWKARMFALGIGVLVTATLVLIIKFMVKRKRPESEWGEIYRATDPHSFPSGHAARSFMLAAMVIGLGPTWLAIVLLISRILRTASGIRDGLTGRCQSRQQRLN